MDDEPQFTCGNWIAENPIPENKPTYSQTAMLTDKVEEQMRGTY
ncbi:unnamed protein product [Cylicostephanus goldi]|uniref:Peptidase M13 N-terminal domain-containing protein n=1 Tax=Cylicostephanus goldi TaxID=71465 RepID=A0A3P6RFD4_CYLGO|nr:unnamed protein product [Cylicostephanus goldi]